MPYASKQTKARAKRIVQAAPTPSRSYSSLLLLLALPALAFWLNSQTPFLNTAFYSDFLRFSKSKFASANEQLKPYLFNAKTLLLGAVSQDSDEESSDFGETSEEAKSKTNAASAMPILPTTPQKGFTFEVLPLEYVNANLTKDDFLNDRYNRIPEVFKISSAMKKRVGFWFDIYTRYSSNFHVIHHVDYPWIVYKVIDTEKILNGEGHKWTKYHRAQALVKKEAQKVRAELAHLSRIKSYEKLSEEQQRYYNILSELPGTRKSVFLKASLNVRAQLGQKDFFRKGVVAASKYLPLMEEIFAQYDLPVELTRLPLVESSFNENAVSKVGASGIWQFMPGIGKRFLKVTDGIDERNSPLKATEAAAKLLLQNFKITKNWPFAITAYNHGPGGVLSASRKVRSNDLAVIIEKYSSERFGFASSNFFASYLAALHGEKYHEEIFGPLPKYPPHKSDIIRISTSFKAKTLADIVGITMEELRLFNPDLKARAITANSTLPAGYRVFLPAGRKARLELYLAELAELKKKKRVRVSKRNSPQQAKRL